MSAFWNKLRKEKDEKVVEKESSAVEGGKEEKKEDEKEENKSEESKEVKKETRTEEPKQEEKKAEKKEPKETKQEKKGSKGKKGKKKKKEFPREHAIMINNIILRPKVSEAAMNQQTLAKYVFYVNPDASKNEVAKAVEAMYKVNVRKVNIIKYGQQTRRFRGFEGTKKGFKKAIVSLSKGESIDVFSE